MPEQKKPLRLFKGPLFHRQPRQARTLSDVPVGRGVIDEEDFARAGYDRERLRRRKEAREEAEQSKESNKDARGN